MTNHECSACVGTGCPMGKHRFIDEVCVPCPVCHGSGRISDVMPVSDALADAETLRRNIGINDYSPEFQCWIGSPSTYALNRAVVNADMAIRGARDFAYERAILAAQDAFRAVPGLRGVMAGTCQEPIGPVSLCSLTVVPGTDRCPGHSNDSATEKAREHLDLLILSDAHSSDVDPGTGRE